MTGPGGAQSRRCDVLRPVDAQAGRLVILLTDLLTATLDNHGLEWKENPREQDTTDPADSCGHL
jgi:hypothetical protein